jgi:L-ascorbate metabolism protein UlaG (beta-lactamase superfamily)
VKLRLIRNATLLLELGRRRILVDPMLRDAGSTPPIENTPNPVPNPLVGLPVPAGELVRGLDGCIVTHLHSDHFDPRAIELLPRTLPLLTQPASESRLREHGFVDVTAFSGAGEWLGLRVVRTGGHHGTGEVGVQMGPVSGFVLDGLYLAGDTILCGEVLDAIRRHRPRTIVVNAGGARFNEGDPIVMTVEDVRGVRAATDATIVAVHLEAMNHCVETRADVRAVEGILVPEDGETLDL